jgi:thiol-disulfide isomerase/thioredoxin
MNLPAALLRRIASMLGTAGVLGFLYVSGPSGKEAAAYAAEPQACKSAQKIAPTLEALAKGDLAALAISKTPETLPELSFVGPDGSSVSLSSFRGKTILFNLWATWCVPCRGEMPQLDKLQSQLGSDKFQVVAVNIDTTRPERPKALFQELGLKSLALYTDPKANSFYELKQAGKALGLPLSLLIDGEGCQLGLLNGPAAWGSPDAQALIVQAIKASQP